MTTWTHAQFANPAVNTQGDVGRVPVKIEIDWEALTGDASIALTDGDIVKAFKVPGWVKILRASIDNNVDLDDGGNTLDIDVKITDGATTKTIINGGTTTGGAGLVDSDDSSAYASGVDGIDFVTDNGDYYVYLEVIATATGDATASAKTKLLVEYTRVLTGTEGTRDFPSPIPS